MVWTVQFLDDDVRDALEALPRDIRARFERIVDLIKSHGLERVREPAILILASDPNFRESSCVLVRVAILRFGGLSQ